MLKLRQDNGDKKTCHVSLPKALGVLAASVELKGL